MIFNIHLLSPLTLKALGLVYPLLTVNTRANCKASFSLSLPSLHRSWIVGLGCVNNIQIRALKSENQIFGKRPKSGKRQDPKFYSAISLLGKMPH